MKTVTLARFLVALSALLGMLGPSPAAGVSLRFDPLAQTVPLGQQALVQIEIAGTVGGAAPSIGSYDLDVAFDEAILAAADVRFGPLLGNPLSTTAVDISVAGLVNLAEVSFLSPSELDGLQPDTFVLATLAFDTVSTGTSSLAFARILVGDAFGLALDVEGGTASITVVPVPEPGTLLLVGLGLIMTGLMIERRVRTQPGRST